jgi:glycosyltransferase involved in cell wall biosynthesis
MIAFTNIEYTIELTEALTNIVDVILMIPEEHAKRFCNKINDNIKLKSFTKPRLREIANLLFVYKMIKRINQLKPDVIHLQRGHPWLNFGLPFLRKYLLVNTIHDVNLHVGDKESSKIPFFTHKFAINNAKKIIVHSEKLKTEFTQKYNKFDNDVHVIPRGINSIYNRYTDKFIQEEENTILFFGRIWPYKGLRYLIEAEPHITHIIPDAKIIIAGRGEDVIRNYQPFMANPNKFKIYNKHISNNMVAELFHQASVVVLPYIEASQSGVVPLAYSFKKPVVVTNVGSLSEIVDNGITGFVVPSKDPEKLADRIIYLLKNKETRKKMGENAYRKATQELSWKEIAAKTVEVYEKSILQTHH